MKLSVLVFCLFLVGCAEKRPVTGRVIRYQHCKEISVDAKTGDVTLKCPAIK